MIPILIAALAVQAAPAAAPCPPATTIAAPFAAWRDGRPAADGVVVGRAADLTPVSGGNAGYRAMVPFDVAAAGRHAVAVGGVAAPVRPVWLDIAGRDGTPLRSVAHGPGQACTGMTKVVEFDLMPGHYVLMLSRLASAARVRVLIVRK